jgi:haloalkane dehalogenase
MPTPESVGSHGGTTLVAERPAWLAYDEYPFASRYVEIDGSRVHYVDEGAGPLLLFVHAGPAWSFIFRDLIVRLRGQFRCVALDFPSSGLSRAARGYQPTVAASTDILERFIDALDLRDITLVAHDIGGPVGLGDAVRRPERFRGFVLTDTFGWSLREHPHITHMLGIVGSPLFGLLNAHFNIIGRATATSVGVGRHLSPAGKAAFLGPYRDETVRRNAATLLADPLRGDAYLRDLERALRTTLSRFPVLLAYGENDPGRREGLQTRFEQIFPHARSVVIAGAHHFPHMDAPDELAAAIVAWWEQERAGQAA